MSKKKKPTPPAQAEQPSAPQPQPQPGIAEVPTDALIINAEDAHVRAYLRGGR